MEIVRTVKVKMSQKEKEAFGTVMKSLKEFCAKMESVDRNDEEDCIFYCGRNALDCLDEFKTTII